MMSQVHNAPAMTAETQPTQFRRCLSNEQYTVKCAGTQVITWLVQLHLLPNRKGDTRSAMLPVSRKSASVP